MKKIADGEFATYSNHRAEPYYTYVKNGQKTIEGRVRKGYYRLIKPGDHIVVYNEKETDHVEVVVVTVRKYQSVRKMLAGEPIKNVLPNVESVEEGIKIYQGFYTVKQEAKFGVVAIEVRKIREVD